MTVIEDDEDFVKVSHQSISEILEDTKTNYIEEITDESPDSSWDNIETIKKINEIEITINADPVDLKKLRELAISHNGYVNDNIRKTVWPLLLSISDIDCIKKIDTDELENHKDYKQVTLDVQRSLSRFPPNIDEDDRSILMEQLTEIIVKILIKYPHLHYYQGYHDVAITFLLVLGEKMGFALVEKLSLSYLKEFMSPTMERTVYYLTYLYPIVRRANPDVHSVLVECKLGTIFCISWLITWFAHSLYDYRNVVRLYDFFLASPPLMPMYFAAAIVIHKEDEVLECERDMAVLHCVLAKIPDTLPFEELIKEAKELYDEFPPDDITDEVNDIIKQNEEEEKLFQEKQYLMKKKRAAKSLFGSIWSITESELMSRWQWTVVNVIGVAFISTIAATFYSYYSCPTS